jgi:hypothetical protein
MKQIDSTRIRVLTRENTRVYTWRQMAARLKTYLHIRAELRELRNWRKSAKHEGKALSEWVRSLLNLGAVPAPAPVPKVVSGGQGELPLEAKGEG